MTCHVFLAQIGLVLYKMQFIRTENHLKSIKFLPITDLNSSNELCIYSTMNFVVKEVSRPNIVPCITFDKPFFAESRLHHERKSDLPVVCRLGGFYTMMSFLDSIWDLMKGSVRKKKRIYLRWCMHCWANNVRKSYSYNRTVTFSCWISINDIVSEYVTKMKGRRFYHV